MGRDREVRGGHFPAPRTRPRYARLGAAGGALAVTLVAMLAGTGLLPPVQGGAAATAGPAGRSDVRPSPAADSEARGAIRLSGSAPTDGTRGDRATAKVLVPTLPADSGTGRRIVFSMADQRVWLVGVEGGEDAVRRTYLVSGSVFDNLQPATYQVYSRSMDAVGVEDSGTMRYMVRFAHGRNAAIGFHDIPELGGTRVQSRAELGRPRSHGCIRQWRPDAKALWDFAPRGTKVVVI